MKSHTSSVEPIHAGPPDISLRALGRLATPIFVANLAVIGSATIDTMMAGRLGSEHLAAVAVGNASAVMILLSLVGILQGLSPIVGNLFGARRYERIGFELVQSFWLSILVTIIGAGLMLWTDLWISMGNVSGNVAEMTTVYLIGAALGVGGAVGSRVFIALNAAINRPKVTMWVSLLMLALKAPINAVFMYGLFGLPALGGGGCGISLAFMGWIGFAIYFYIWKKDKVYDKFRPKRFYWPEWSSLKEHLHLGIPIGLSSFFEVSSFTLMAIFIARLGTVSVAAHQIVANITATFYMIPLSIGIAVSVMVSQCMGANYPTHARTIMYRAYKTAVLLASACALLLFFSRQWLVSLYTADEAVASLACTLLIFGVLYHVTDAAQSVANFSMRGYRVTVLPMIIFGVLLWGVGLGGGLYFGFSGEAFGGPYGAIGFWGSTGSALTLAGIILTIMSVRIANRRIASPNPMR